MQRPVSFFLEHIIQDAGTPGIEDLARELGAEFHRNGQLVFEANPSALRYSPSALGRNAVLKIFSEPDAGMYDAINKGITKAVGDVLAYLNCDEQYLPQCLARVSEFFVNNPQVEMVSGGVLVVDRNGELISKRPGIKPWLWHVYTDHLPLFTAALFWRSQVTKPKYAKFDTRMTACADALWIIDRLRDGTKIQAITGYFAAFAETGTNLNLTDKSQAEQRFIFSISSPIAKPLRRFIVIAHRIRKVFLGCYFPQKISYQIYTTKLPLVRDQFESRRDWGIWWNRLRV